jgi:hypothetical protein
MKQKEKIDIEIKDVPYMYIDYDLFEGSIEDVSKKVLAIREQIVSAYEAREKMIPYKYTPLEQYEDIRIRCINYNDRCEFGVYVFRKETDEELKLRLDKERQLKNARKKRETELKRKKEEEERALYEELKKKFETNS